MDDKRLMALRKRAGEILREKGIRPEEGSRLREVRARMKDDAAYIELLETLLAYRQRLAVLEGLARDQAFAGFGWARQVILD